MRIAAGGRWNDKLPQTGWQVTHRDQSNEVDEHSNNVLTEDGRLLAWIVKQKSCACVERGARLMVCMWVRFRSIKRD